MWVRNDPDWLKKMAREHNEDGSEKDEYAAEFEKRIHQPDGGFEVWETAFVKWDGCIEYTRYFNAPKSVQEKLESPEPGAGHPDNWDQRRIHICGIPEFVANLLALDKEARKELYKYDCQVSAWKPDP
jgi:hypothetical protein